jgi:Uma2 family endonuclease
MATQRVVLTYEDYAALPNDGRRYEIHDGELSVTPSPGTPHQEIIGNLYVVLRQHVDRQGFGKVFVSPLDVILSNTTVVQPDLLYVEPARSALISQRAIEGAPTLAVEVISPSTPKIDRNTKFRLYARYQVPYYWIVDPEARTIEAYQLVDAGYRLVARADDREAVSLPPFSDLALVPEAIWP